MQTARHRRRGSFLIEFTLCAIPLIFLLIAMVQMSMTMWHYHTLAEAISYATRTASSRGAGCVGKACASTIGTMAQLIVSRSIGLSASDMNVTFSSDAAGTSDVVCNPLSTCTSSGTAWPSTAPNVAGTNLTIRASYVSTVPMMMYAPKWGTFQFNRATLAAQSRQMVVY